jgi:hypothetical protein
MRKHFVQGWICLAVLLSGVNALAGTYCCRHGSSGCYATPSCCGPTSGCCQRALEEAPWQEGMPPSEGMPPEQAPDMAAAAAPAMAAAGGFGGGAFASGPGGYIDPAIVATRFRVRYDNMQDAERPDRAEMFYSRQANFGLNNLDEVDLEEVSVYLELEVACGLSFFVELPFRSIEARDNTGATLLEGDGISDVNFGFRYALQDCCGQALTFQLRVYAETGDEVEGVGTGHSSIEPAILFQRQVASDATFFGEFRAWIPTDGTFDPGLDDEVAGTVLRYGVGLSYDLWQSCCRRCCSCQSCCRGCQGCCQSYCHYSSLAAVVEFVGWTVLDGGKTEPDGTVVSAEGDTIFNIKIGARYTSGPHSFYGGWGHALTGDQWYDDIARAEYRYTY